MQKFRRSLSHLFPPVYTLTAVKAQRTMLYTALSEGLDQRRRQRGCCCGFTGSTSLVFASIFALVAFVLNIIPLSGTGDIFYAGWDISGGDSTRLLSQLPPQPSPLSGHPASLVLSPTATASPKPTPSPLPSTPSTGIARLTIKSINFCDSAAGDTFCTDFFASRRVSTFLFPGGSNLVSVARTNQFYFGGAFALGVVTVLRLIVASCKASTRGGVEEYCTPLRVSRVTGLAGAALLGAAALGALALKQYSDAAGNFFTLSQLPLKIGPNDWSFEAGWQCGAAAVGLNCAAALLLFAVSGRNRREAKREREAGGGGGGDSSFPSVMVQPMPSAPPFFTPTAATNAGPLGGRGGGTSGGGGPAPSSGGFYPPPAAVPYSPPDLGQGDK